MLPLVYFVRHFPVRQFPPQRLRPSFASPAFSTPAFMIVRHILVMQIQVTLYDVNIIHTKNCENLFLPELRKISTNFDNFWQKDGNEAKIMRGALIFHLTQFASPHYRVKADVPNCYTTL